MVIRQLLLDHLGPVRRAQRRLHHGVRVVGQHGRREREQRRTRDSPASRPRNEARRSRSGTPLPPSNASRTPAAACSAVACSGDRFVTMWISVSPLSVGRSRRSVTRRTARVSPSEVQLHRLLVDHPGGDPADAAAPPAELPGQRRAVLPDHEERPACRQPEQELAGAEVAVGDDDDPGPDPLQQLRQQRPLLGMAVLARHQVDDQLPLRVQTAPAIARATAPRECARSSAKRCSVAARWLPSR